MSVYIKTAQGNKFTTKTYIISLGKKNNFEVPMPGMSIRLSYSRLIVRITEESDYLCWHKRG